jgi:cytochrome c oxidase cbb3-type subunit III
MTRSMRLAVLILAAVLARAAQPADDIAAGGRIYRSHCAECHGLKGEGGRGPDLTRGEYRHGSSDAALARTISRGVPGTQMPGIYHDEFQLSQLVAFVKSLAGAGPREAVPGDAAAGRKFFEGKGGCRQCHLVAGQGGRMGPDLTYVGSARTAAHLRASIRTPDHEISPAWWWYELATKDGRKLAGFRLNEDSYSLQMLDQNENLVSIERPQIRSVSIEKKKSRMPAFASLSGTELDDLVAYLRSLERKRGTE